MHPAQVEGVAEPRRGRVVAAERRRVQDDAAPVGDRVAPAHVVGRPGHPLGTEQDVRARDPEVRAEAFGRLPERVGEMRDHRGRGHETDVVVGVDRHAIGEGLVRPEGLVEHAVAELLEGAAGVPDLHDRRARPRPDDIDRQEVVVDHEQPRRREEMPGAHGLPQHRDAAADRAPREGGQRDDLDRRPARRELGGDAREVAADRVRVGRGQHDAAPHRPATADREAETGRPHPDGDAGEPHRPRMTSSMTRSVEDPSRCAKCRAANAGTFSCR